MEINVHEAIEGRREITVFAPLEIEKGALKRIVRAGYLAPTGNNLPSRELIVGPNGTS